jgi:hypothetical protein
MKKLVALTLIVALAALASAASFTLTLTASQVATVQWKFGKAGSGFANAQDWMSAQIAGEIAGWATEQAQENASAFCVKFNALSVANQNAVCSSLSLANGCNCQ